MNIPASFSSTKRKRDSDSCDEYRCKRPKNNVFVNYLFEDIGKSFISHLKGALTRNGFTMSDHTMLPVIGGGQDDSSQLLKAIEDSEIYAVVLSMKYPYSVRCLDELVLIMDCLRKFKRRVFPIFFNVNPSDVRSQEGSFEEAFQKHENNNVDPERLQKWRQALKDAGQLSGVTCQNGNEEKFLRRTIKLLRKMHNPQELSDVEHPVGIESRARDIISALRLNDQAPSIVAVFVGIFGISGSGKTTIIKSVYDRIAADFDVSCFIQDIHSYEYGGRNWKIKLQKDFISCLTGNAKFMVCHNDGAGKIKRFEQLQALGIHSASFACESRIIVTTRNKHSLGNLPYSLYNIRLLDRKESSELFTGLTFRKDLLVDKKFVDEIACRADGLPLVLEVWSRHFIYHERKQWPRILEILKRIPHEDIQKKLQMSYDSLTNRAKNLFLDIACFLNGMTKKIVFKVLQDEESGVFPDIEIQNLVDKGLIKNNSFYVTLHNVIKEMGHELVRQEYPDEPGKRSRLMARTDALCVLRDNSGTDSVRSIQLNYNHEMKEEVTVQFEALKKMSSLRFIMLRHSKLQWSSSSNDAMSTCFSFKHLKYMEWDWFPFKSLDSIDMRNVVVINLHSSILKKLWEGVKSLKKLKIMHIRFSSSLTKTGNFIGLDNLEQLRLTNCENLEELHTSVGCRQNLVKLDLRDCTNLKSIPNLPPNIQKIEASGCTRLVNLPANISQLQFLEVLILDDCIKLGSKGFIKVTELRNLCKLSMRNCNVSQVSCEIANLVSLWSLDLSDNTFSVLPESFSNLSNLASLYIEDCYELLLLPILPLNLVEIKASGCVSLDVMPFDSMQMAFTFRSKMFEESTIKCELVISLTEVDVPDWYVRCSYQNIGDSLSFVAPMHYDKQICGVILCARMDLEIDDLPVCVYPHMHNQTKEITSNRFGEMRFVGCLSTCVMFCPLDTTLVVEAGDTLVLKYCYDNDRDDEKVSSCGIRWIYEDDVLDSKLVISLFNDDEIRFSPFEDDEDFLDDSFDFRLIN